MNDGSSPAIILSSATTTEASFGRGASIRKWLIFGGIGLGVIGVLLFLFLYLIPNLIGAPTESIKSNFNRYQASVAKLEQVFSAAGNGNLSYADLILTKNEYENLRGNMQDVEELCKNLCGYKTAMFNKDLNKDYSEAIKLLSLRINYYRETMDIYERFYMGFGEPNEKEIRAELLIDENSIIKNIANKIEVADNKVFSIQEKLIEEDCFESKSRTTKCTVLFKDLTAAQSFVYEEEAVREIFNIYKVSTIDYKNDGYIAEKMRLALDTIGRVEDGRKTN